MLADAREFRRSEFWIVTLPGLAILITVVAINLSATACAMPWTPRCGVVMLSLLPSPPPPPHDSSRCPQPDGLLREP